MDKAQELNNLLNEIVGEQKKNEVFDILIKKLKTNPNGIKPKLMNFKFYSTFL